jgi:hypothetical protein
MADILDLLDIYENTTGILLIPKSKKPIGKRKSQNQKIYQKVKKHVAHVKITPHDVYKICANKKRKLKNKSKILNTDRYWKNQNIYYGVGPDIEEFGDFNENDYYGYYDYWDNDDWYERRYNRDYDEIDYSFYYW